MQISIECELPCSSVWWDYLSYIRLISWIHVVAVLNILCFIPARANRQSRSTWKKSTSSYQNIA